MKTRIFIIVALSILVNYARAQNIFPSSGAAGIGTTTPDASSLLEIKSTSKGLLISRMTQTQRNAIVSPATGLLIYQTNATPGFYYYNGSAWTAIGGSSTSAANKSLSNLTAPTAVNTDLLPDSNNKRNLGTSALSWKRLYVSGDATINGITVGRGANGTSGDVAIGNLALSKNNGGYQNTAIGDAALQNNKTGGYNVAVGLSALQANTGGFNNTAVGQRAMYLNTTGGDNTACGQNALYSNTAGSDNTASGFQSLFSNIEGSENTATGYQSLYSAPYGIANSATGYQSLYSNTGSYNVAEGYRALYDNTSGSDNTAIGYAALEGTTSGHYLTTVGYNSGTNDTAYYYSTALGQESAITADNQVRIGDFYTTSIGGYDNWTNISDGRVKKNIRQNVPGLAFIKKLQPITYNLDLDAADRIIKPLATKDNVQPSAREVEAKQTKEKIVYTGFVAQDVEKAAKEIGYDFSGVDAAKNDKDLYGLRYADFVVPLVKAVQELSAKNDSLQGQIATQQKINGDLQNQIDELRAMITSGATTSNVKREASNISEALLQQNIPNPFNQSSTIRFYLPSTANKASIVVTDASGKTIKQFSNLSQGNGTVTIEANSLTSGTYMYTLIVDGKKITTKQMLITK